MTFVKSLLLLVALIAIADAWVRFAPLPRARLSAHPGPMEPGVHPMRGGVKIVRPLADLPPDALDKLARIAAGWPRTKRVGDDPIAFVTRSKLWGFPDIALIWSDGMNLHLHSHLVFGSGDLGVNAARVSRWLQALERGER
jgi:hypothetical protein